MRKLAWASGAFAAGIFAACFLLPGKLRLYAAIAVLLLGLTGLFFHGNRRLRILLAAGFAALGLAWTQAHYTWFIAPLQAMDGVETVAVLRVQNYPQVYESYTTVSAQLLSGAPRRCKVTLYDYDGLCDEFCPGDEIRVTVKFHSAVERYDEEIWSYTSKGVFLVGTMRDAPVVTARHGNSLIYLPARLAKMLKTQVQKCFPDDVSAFMTALLTGDKTRFYENTRLNVAMERAGLLHIVAVSGMHIAFLIGFLQTILGKRRLASLLCLPVIVVFIFMTGCSPSVLRAGIMQILLLVAPLSRRESDRITSFCAVLALLLAVNPQSARSASLQLSFAATLGILLLTPRIHNCLWEWLSACPCMRHKIIKSLWLFFSTTLATNLGALAFTVPIMALTFGSVSLISPLSNLFTLWMVSLCFSLGLLCCIVGAVLPFLGAAFGWCIAWGVRYIIFVVQWFGSLRFASVSTANPIVMAWLISVYIIILLCWLFRGKRGFRATIPVCLSVCLLLAAGFATRLMDSRDALRFTVLNVGQGQCLLLQSGGHTLMLDCGGPYSEDVGTLSANYVDSRFLPGVDVLAMTHLHSDHASGVVELLYRVPVKTIILPADDRDEDMLLNDILTAAKERGTEIIYLDQDSLLQLGALELTMYAPRSSGSVNERGIVYSGKVGDFDFLVPGDISATSERLLLRRAALPRAELLVVGHHGSKNATCRELLTAIRPETAIISVGGNSYGHPTPETLQRLAAAGAQVYRTDHSGNITIHVPK